MNHGTLSTIGQPQKGVRSLYVFRLGILLPNSARSQAAILCLAQEYLLSVVVLLKSPEPVQMENSSNFAVFCWQLAL